MPRKPGVWQRGGTDWYYTTIGKEKIRLSKDKKQAEKMLLQLLLKKHDEPEPAKQLGPSFRKLADEYLKATQDTKGDRPFAEQVKTFKLFVAHIRQLRACDLQPHMISSWLAKQKTWGTSTKTIHRKRIKAVLNWGVREGHLSENPLKKMPSGTSENRDRVLTVAERKTIAETVPPKLAEFLRAVELTGCRPFSEMAMLEASMVDFEAGTATIQKHKNRKKTGKPRVIYLVPELLDMLRRKAEEHPTGPLFRNHWGRAWTTIAAWKWFREVKEKTGIEAFPYAYRATYITEALIRGVPVEVVAELCGNTPAIIWKHYSHVVKDKGALRAAAMKAVG